MANHGAYNRDSVSVFDDSIAISNGLSVTFFFVLPYIVGAGSVVDSGSVSLAKLRQKSREHAVTLGLM